MFAQAVAAVTEANIDTMREKYVSVAETACVLFFSMNALQHIDSMYQVRGCRCASWRLLCALRSVLWAPL